MSNTLLSKKDFFDSFFNSSLDIVAKIYPDSQNQETVQLPEAVWRYAVDFPFLHH